MKFFTADRDALRSQSGRASGERLSAAAHAEALLDQVRPIGNTASLIACIAPVLQKSLSLPARIPGCQACQGGHGCSDCPLHMFPRLEPVSMSQPHL